MRDLNVVNFLLIRSGIGTEETMSGPESVVDNGTGGSVVDNGIGSGNDDNGNGTGNND